MRAGSTVHLFGFTVIPSPDVELELRELEELDELLELDELDELDELLDPLDPLEPEPALPDPPIAMKVRMRGEDFTRTAYEVEVCVLRLFFEKPSVTRTRNFVTPGLNRKAVLISILPLLKVLVSEATAVQSSSDVAASTTAVMKSCAKTFVLSGL
jgi:hypothetical protein